MWRWRRGVNRKNTHTHSRRLQSKEREYGSTPGAPCPPACQHEKRNTASNRDNRFIKSDKHKNEELRWRRVKAVSRRKRRRDKAAYRVRPVWELPMKSQEDNQLMWLL